MSALAALKEQACDSAVRRGHMLKPWEDHGTYSNSECRVCGKWVQVNTRPMPNDIDVGGPAVALNCGEPE